MFKNYLKLTFRNFKRRKGHTFINILGLAIALSACIFIGVYLQYELSYDEFLSKSDRMYRVSQTSITPEKHESSATTPYALAPTLESEYPRLIDQTVRFFNTMADEHTFILREEGADRSDFKSFLEPHFFFTDSTFFEVTGVSLIRGNPQTALDKPLSLVLTPQKARKFFGDEDPMGKTITFETKSMKMTVTGIMEPLPSTSHIKADMLASMNSLDLYYVNPENVYENWFGNRFYTYVVLNKGTSPDELTRNFSAFVEKYYAQTRDKNETFEIGLQPVERIHLHSNLNYEMQPNSSIFYIYLFLSSALLLLIIACINFMNLSTARAAERSKEVGMRKALGAGRVQLFWQFMGESLFLSFIAVVIAVLLVAGSLPFINDFVGMSLVFNPLQNIPVLLGIVGLFVIVGFLAGGYPAVYLSGFEPQQILQGGLDKSRGGSFFRKCLVTIQFVMSIILVIGTVIVFLQLNHMQQKKLGFDKEHIVIMPIKQNLIAWEYPAFKEKVEQSSAIRSVTGIGKILGSQEQDSWKIAPAGKGGTQGETNHTIWVMHDFVETFGLDVVAGRSFSKDFAADGGRSILINQKMAQKIGAENPRDAIGAPFYYTTKEGEKQPLQVVGVVKDFNYTSLKKEIKPTIICLSNDQRTRLGAINFAAAKIMPGRTQDALNHLENIWSEINFIDPFNYSFQQKELDKIYASEATTTQVMAVFTILCIIVACLGLFGLASFTATQRTKEIGIRKTLGASVGNIVLLLSKQYLKLLLIANIIAWPVIYYLAAWWLRDFPYRVTLGWNILVLFVVVGLASLCICLITVGSHSVKAALVNPVESIRQE